MSISPVPAVGSLSSPRLGIAIAAWEILLGVWLLMRYDCLSWLAGVITFATFAIASCYSGIIGVSNCGCFGAIKASPWAAFTIDLIVLAVLLIFRPKDWYFTNRARLLQTLKPIAVYGIFAVLLLGTAAWVLGGPAKALSLLRNEEIALSAEYLDFGSGAVGDRKTVSIHVDNFSNVPLHIFGGTSDCSCTTTSNLPVTIPPGASAEIPVEMKIPNSKSGRMTRVVRLMTDNPKQRELRFRIGCRVN